MEKYLEMIQSVVTRMAKCSFLLKGWSVTLIAAIFGLAAKDSNPKFVLISYFIIPFFWLLDGYFLSQERQYRALFDTVRKVKSAQPDYDMDASSYSNGKNSWLRSTFSVTLNVFYFPLFTVVIAVMSLFS